MTAQRYVAFEDWQVDRGITPWTAIHPVPAGHIEVDTACQPAFEVARWREQAAKFERLWHEEFTRAAGYRAQLQRASLVPFDADEYRAPDLDEGVA